MAEVLVCGIYLADREHCAGEEIIEISTSRDHQVTQRWLALDVSGNGNCELDCTVGIVRQSTPKFTLVNEMSKDIASFDYLIVCDDDIALPSQFIDNFLGNMERLDLALAQPARTPDSYIDHFITMRMPGLIGRVTRFVEIGPVICIHRSAFGLLLPFDTTSPMGWGLDFVWPKLIETNSLRMGIIDDTPVTHSMRPPLKHYARTIVEEDMEKLLKRCPHLSYAEAFTVLEAHA